MSSPIIEFPIFKSKLQIGVCKAGITASFIAHFRAEIVLPSNWSIVSSVSESAGTLKYTLGIFQFV